MDKTPAEQTAEIADELLHAFLDVNPVGATLLGLRDHDHRLPDYTGDAEAAYRGRLAGITARAEQVDPAALTTEERITRAVVREVAELERARLDARAVEYTVTDSFFAPAFEVLSLLPMVPITEPAHADGYLARLAGLPDLLTVVAGRHRDGIAAGRLPVGRLVRAAVDHLDRVLSDPAHDPLRRPEPLPDGATPGPVDLPGFRRQRDRLLAEVVHPALGRYRDALTTHVLPHGRPPERPGLCWLPGGDGYYPSLVRAHTTTDLSPETLHRTGLDIIARLEAEYAEIGSRVFGTRDVTEILTRLRDDPALRWRDGSELLEHARRSIERAELAAPEWFGLLPSTRCAVVEVPAVEAPGAPAAYYFPPALDGSRPGTYFANTHGARQRGRAGYEAIAFHEGVPGHHFQLTLAQELTDLPLLRRLVPFTAYAEGWGLYAERLADEMGLYSDDIAKLGMLSEDSMRAARLVVDTGLHAKGWSRQRVVDYLLANTATPAVEVESEADRYIAAPGQALAYMVGRLEIQRLRGVAEHSLGDRFDIRGFHDTVLGHGALPLAVLNEVVRDWVAQAA